MSRVQLRSLVAVAAVAAVAGGCGLIKVKGNVFGTKLGSTEPVPAASAHRARTAQRRSRGRTTTARRPQWEQQVIAGEGYKGPECGRVLADMSQVKKSHQLNNIRPVKDDALDKQIYLLVCAREQKSQRYSKRMIVQPATVRPMDVASLHFQFDDRRPDHVKAAMIAIRWAYMRKGRSAFSGSKHLGLWGLAHTYAGLVDAGRLQSQLGALKVPAEAAKFFLARFEKAKAKVAENVATVDPALRPMMVELPRQLLKQRRAYFSKYAALYQRLDALKAEAKTARASGNARAVLAKLNLLRSDYIKSCGKLACQYTPIYAETSRELALAYVAAKDAMGARLESQPFMRDGSYVVSFAQQLGVEQRRAGRKLAAAWSKYRQAKGRGVDDATARSVAGGPAFNFRDRDMLIWPKTSVPNYGAALGRSKTKSFKATVKSLKRTGDGVRVTFRKHHYTASVPYACRRTRRVSRIRRDGSLEYERNCKWKKVRRVREIAKPVVLPKVEARHLRPGDEVRGLRLDEQGRVIRVERKKKAIQLRQDRVRS